MEVNKYNPLVTVAVVTYNSSRFVLETLESIKCQTYQNIELIVADDCSKDETVEICKQWINDNKDRFVRTELITTHVNSGTAGNANRAFYAAKGEWIKYIAGDDLFCKDAIENYIDFVNQNLNVYACFGEAIHFYEDIKSNTCEYKRIELEKITLNKNITAKKQYSILKRVFFGCGSTFFVKKSVLEAVGGFDERFPLHDDYPLFIKITKNGVKIHLLDKFVLYKRNHRLSVVHNRCDDSLYTNFTILCVKEYGYQYKRENLNKMWCIFLSFSLYLQMRVIQNGNSKRSLKCRLLYYQQRILDPFVWYDRILHWLDLLA